MKCKDFCIKYPDCLKYKLVRNQKGFKGEVDICSTPECFKKAEPVEEVSIKQLTIDELREQFESNDGNWENCSRHGENYCNGSVQNRWKTWQECARANKIIKGIK